MRSIDESFYKSVTWKKAREAYYLKVGGMCERCKAKGLVRPADIIHHKEHLTPENMNDAATAYGFDNLEALCQECHNKEHMAGELRRRFTVDSKGNVIYKEGAE